VSASAAALTLGVVLIGPICAGPEIEGRPCPSIPWAGIPVRLLPEGPAAGRQTLELITDAQGRFAGAIAAGRWRVEVLAAKPARCPLLTLDLPRPADAPLPMIDCDSGRR
jgi:hypothetical protein